MASSWEASVAAHKERVREAIMRSASELVAERGVAGTTMSELAERAGITRKTLYSYFPDLEHVLLARIGLEVDEYLEGLAAELATMPDPLDRLRHYVLRQLRYFARDEHRGHLASLEAAGLSEPMAAEVARHFGRLQAVLVEILDDGVAAGALRANLDSGLVAHAVLELLGVLRLAVLRGERTPERGTDELLALLLDGLRQRASP